MIEAQEQRRSRRVTIKSADLLAIGAFVLLGAVVCLNHLANVADVSSLNSPDHTQYEWLFSHGAYSLRHLENPLFSFRQNMPLGVNVVANPAMLGIVVLLAPATMLLGPQAIYAVYLAFALAATATTTYWVLSRHLISSRLGAFVGGAFIGFAPGVVHHANGQPIWASNFLLPIILLCVFKLGEPGRRVRRGVILGVLVTCQLFINQEMLLIFALACAVIIVLYTFERWSEARIRAVPFLQSLIVTGVVVLVLAGYPLWFQFFGPQSFRGLQGGAFHTWGEDLLAFVTFARDTIAGSPSAERTVGVTEQNTWFGWPLVVVAGLATFVLARSSLKARITGIVALVFGIASLGPELRFNGRLTGVPGPWRLISQDLPVLEWMIPSRLALVTVGAVGLLLALAVERATKVSSEGRRSARSLRFAVYAAVGAALLPLVPRPLGTHAVEDLPRFLTSGAWRRYVPEDRSLVPIPIPSNLHGLETLRWSALTEQEFAVPGGYFIGPDANGNGTGGAPARPTAALANQTIDTGEAPVVTTANQADAIEDLRFWRASVVVLGPHPRETQLLKLVTDLLGSPQRVDDVWLWDVKRVVG